MVLHCQRTARLNFDALENRDMPSVASVVMTGSILTVTANNSATSVAVQPFAGRVLVKDLDTNATWLLAGVAEVRFTGGSSSDSFINGVPGMSCKAWGNGGNDYLQGWTGSDWLYGGIGDDTLVGFGGNDRLYGDAGQDTLRGADGDDMQFGGDGNDQLIGGADADKLWGGRGDDILIALDDGTTDYTQGDTGRNALWLDAGPNGRDSIPGGVTRDRLQWVVAFANGADRTLDGDSIADPQLEEGAVYKRFASPLFSPLGPMSTDPRQGDVGDCWLMAALGAIAMDNPTALRQNVVDFGDGTYGVRLGNSFYRVDGDLPARSAASTNTAYAGLGAGGSLWVAIVEKAYAQHRVANDTSNSYYALEAGWSVEVNRAFGAGAVGDVAIGNYPSATALGNGMYNAWKSYRAVTIGFVDVPATGSLVNGHMYQVLSFVRNGAGQIIAVNLRNPWGVDGISSDANTEDGLVTVSLATLYACEGRVNWGRV